MANRERWRCREYLEWEETLPCANCGSEAGSTAHHFIGEGNMRGMAVKAPDDWTMPLCSVCHTKIHGRRGGPLRRNQYEWVARTRGLFFKLMVQELGPDTMRTLVKGVARHDVIGGRV